MLVCFGRKKPRVQKQDLLRSLPLTLLTKILPIWKKVRRLFQIIQPLSLTSPRLNSKMTLLFSFSLSQYWPIQTVPVSPSARWKGISGAPAGARAFTRSSVFHIYALPAFPQPEVSLKASALFLRTWPEGGLPLRDPQRRHRYESAVFILLLNLLSVLSL